MKFNLAIFLVVLFFVSCQTEKERKMAIILGKYNGNQQGQVRLEELKTGRLIPLDSVKITTNGDFQLKVLPVEAGFYLLRFPNDQEISLMLDKQDTIKLNVDTSAGFLDYEISGNQSSRMLNLYHLKSMETLSTIDSLREVLMSKKYDSDFAIVKPSIDSTLEEALSQHRFYTQQLIRNNPGEMASILLINKAIVGQPIFTTGEDADLYFLIEDSLLANYPSNSHVKAHARRMDRLREKLQARAKTEARVGIGKKVPPLKLADVSGKQRSLEEFRGRNLILFFWASWSPECRADIQLLKSKYSEWEKSGVEIFAVSFDHKESFWKAAVETENPEWVNVSDLAGIESPVAGLFNITDRLPFYYLIDPNGLILSKTPNFGELKRAIDALPKPTSSN